jgi:hypothetical protein
MSDPATADIMGLRMDCRAACSAALARLGITVAPDAFDGNADVWESVTEPQRGDVILSRPDGRLHVTLVLNSRPGHGLVMSSDAHRGVHVMTLSRALADRIGIYRYRGLPT